MLNLKRNETDSIIEMNGVLPLAMGWLAQRFDIKYFL